MNPDNRNELRVRVVAAAEGVLARQEIAPEVLAARRAAGERVQLVAVRTRAEFDHDHMAGAVSVPTTEPPR